MMIRVGSTYIHHDVYLVQHFEKRAILNAVLDAEDPAGTLVFVQTNRQADFLASYLSENNHPATSIHSARYPWQREEALYDFRSGRMMILIATSANARELDIPNMRHVINFQLPNTIDKYLRHLNFATNWGRATTFYDAERDAGLSGDLVLFLDHINQQVPHFLNDQQQHGGDEEEW